MSDLPTHLRNPMPSPQLIASLAPRSVVTLCVLLEPPSSIVTRADDVTCTQCRSIIAAVKEALDG